MSAPKILIAALILGLGVTGAYLIVSSSETPELPLVNNGQNIVSNNPVGIEPIGANASATNNLTDILMQKLGESIVQENQEGIKTIDGKGLINAPEPKKMVEDLIAEAQKNFDPASLRPKISDSSLKISEDSGKEALSNYFNSFNRIMVAAAQKMPDSINEPEKLIIADFKIIKEALEGAINGLYGLAVPRLALNIHKKEIELLTIKKNIYEKVANAEQDPMTALLAANELLKTDQEFDKLKADTENFIRTYLSK